MDDNYFKQKINIAKVCDNTGEYYVYFKGK